MSGLYRFYPLFALALLAALSFWLERVSRSEEAAPPPAVPSGPDFSATQARIRGHGDDGQPSYELQAQTLQHFPDRDVFVLSAPSLSLHQGERNTVITAERAEVLPGGEQVELFDEVRVRQAATSTHPALALDTDALSVWPDAQRALSSHPVLLRRDHSQATALGMRADNLFGNFELSGEVRVSMPPRQGPRS